VQRKKVKEEEEEKGTMLHERASTSAHGIMHVCPFPEL
jgi:hypothetical protein